MVSEGEIWTLERDLCRCCHAEGSFDNLATPQSFMDQEEIYSDMLRHCFDIDITLVPGALCAVTYTICPSCVLKLRDASAFKKQVQLCEEKFLELYYKKAITVKGQIAESEANVKDEPEIFYPTEYQVEFSPDEDDDMDSDGKFELHDPELDQSDDEICEEKLKKEVTLKKAVKLKKEIKLRKEIIKREPKTKARAKTQKREEKTQKGEEKAQNKEEKKNEGAGRKRNFRLQPTDYRIEGKLLCCMHCEKTFEKKWALSYHLRTVHYKVPKYTCDICNMEFMTMSPFTLHKLHEHNIDDRFYCTACQAIFNNKTQLKRHTNGFHMLGVKYKCPSCDYESFSFESLYKHKFKHKTVKDYQCRFCKKAFLRKSTLDLHEKIHTGDRRKVCQICGQAFVQKASLNYHMTKYHPAIVF